MRQTYHVRLDALGDHGARMCRLAGDTLRDATKALLDANLSLAEEVINQDAKLDEMRSDTEAVALELLALQSPVASDLRIVVSALWIVADLQRMGALAIHVAKAARRRHPHSAAPAAIRPLIAAMGATGVRLANQAEEVLRTRNLELAHQMVAQDADMDELHQRVFATLLAPTWTAGVGPAVDIAMLGRFYERFADHAVAAARRVVFLVTGDNVGGDTAPALTAPES